MKGMLSRRLPILLPTLALALFQTDAKAVILAGGIGSENITAPGDDFGFNNVGVINAASGVYLGNGWVISAYHVVQNGSGGFSFSNVSFAGTPYTVNTPTAVRLQNADTSLTDLALFRLNTMPPLPEITLSLSTPDVGSNVSMLGFGRNREAAETHWDVNTGPDPDVWTETPSAGDQQGYKWAGGNAMRWGTNNLATFNAFPLPPLAQETGVINYGLGNVTTIKSNFSDTGGSEAQAAVGDSGGGVFFKNGTQWELSGLMLAVNGLNGQPADNAVYGNETFSADIATYRGQIVDIIPEPGSAVLLLIGAGTLLRRRR